MRNENSGDIVATIRVGDEPGESYVVEYGGGNKIEVGGPMPQYWALANVLDYVAEDWEANACYIFGSSSGLGLCAWCKKALPLTSMGRTIVCPFCQTDNMRTEDDPTPTEVETVVFTWSRNNGDCYDCGNPAAFFDDTGIRYCAVCAANHAADGASIVRIEPEVRDFWVVTWEWGNDEPDKSGRGWSALRAEQVEVYDHYFREVKSWTDDPRAATLRLVRFDVPDHWTDDDAVSNFKEQRAEDVVVGSGGTVVITTELEATS